MEGGRELKEREKNWCKMGRGRDGGREGGREEGGREGEKDGGREGIEGEGEELV